MPPPIQLKPQSVRFGPWQAPGKPDRPTPPTAPTLAEGFAKHGLEISPTEFQSFLAALAEELFPGQSHERIVCSDDSVRLCDEARKRLGAELANEVIRQELLNARSRSISDRT